PWLLVNGALLAVFNLWDQHVLDQEERERPGSQLEALMEHEPLRIEGTRNFLFLAAVVAAIYAAGRGVAHGGTPWPFGAQEACMLLLAAASWLSTPPRIRAANSFRFAPIVEVATLFA